MLCLRLPLLLQFGKLWQECFSQLQQLALSSRYHIAELSWKEIMHSNFKASLHVYANGSCVGMHSCESHYPMQQGLPIKGIWAVLNVTYQPRPVYLYTGRLCSLLCWGLASQAWERRHVAKQWQGDNVVSNWKIEISQLGREGNQSTESSIGERHI